MMMGAGRVGKGVADTVGLGCNARDVECQSWAGKSASRQTARQRTGAMARLLSPVCSPCTDALAASLAVRVWRRCRG